MIYIAAIGYLCLVALLIYVSYSKHFKYYTAAKAMASAGFIILACVATFSVPNANSKYFYMLLPCLALCFVGDVLLGVANNKGKMFSSFFLKGVIAFMLAHIGFCIVFSTLSPFNVYDLALPIFSVLITFLCSKSSRFRFKRMKLPIMAYSLFVGLMCARGISAAIFLGGIQGALIFTGSILFLISDGIILLLYFHVKPRKMMRFANLFTYYIALLLIALSCAF